MFSAALNDLLDGSATFPGLAAIMYLQEGQDVKSPLHHLHIPYWVLWNLYEAVETDIHAHRFNFLMDLRMEVSCLHTTVMPVS